MIIFDQLRISDDGKRMYINVHVNTAKYFEDVYLKSITIMTADKVLESDPGCPTEDYVYKGEFKKDSEGKWPKEAALVLNKGSFDEAFNNINSEGAVKDSTKPYAKISFEGKDLSGDLFFVYVETQGSTSGDSCLPCRFDEKTTVGVTFDENLLYQRVMDFTRELADDCIIPQGFTDFILLWNAFKASIETEHFKPAIDYYNMLFGNTAGGRGIGSGLNSSRKGCGCHE